MNEVPKKILKFVHSILFSLRFSSRSAHWRSDLVPQNSKFGPIIVSGYLSEVLGIGRAGQLIASGLERLQVDVIREDLRPFERGLIARQAWAFPEGKTASAWVINANPPEAKIALFTHDYAVWKDLYRIGCWAWESSIAPANWVPMARWFHEIWVPSLFVAEALTAAFIKAGRKDYVAKLYIVPLPVLAPEMTPQKGTDRVQVLSLFDPRSDFDRKNPFGAIEAWLKAFPRTTENLKLLVKSHASAKSHPRYQALEHATIGRSDIELIAATLDDTQIHTLISESDILLSLHRGEGYGLPLLESMAHGSTVVATGWSGNLQFMTEHNSILIPYHLISAPKNYNGPMACWAEPDLDAAARALKKLANNFELRSALGRQAQKDAKVLCSNWIDLDALRARIQHSNNYHKNQGVNS